jgi:hypothetical protein
MPSARCRRISIEERGERDGTAVHAKLVQFSHFFCEGSLKVRGLVNAHGNAPSAQLL